MARLRYGRRLTIAERLAGMIETTVRSERFLSPLHHLLEVFVPRAFLGRCPVRLR